jgi:lipopolysaccharide exporter
MQTPIIRGNLFSKPSSSFAGNILKLATGSAFAQGLGILTAPILTRLFAPEAFGIAGLFTSISSIIAVVACLRYELSIMLPKTDEEAANLLGLSLCLVIIITVITALIILFTGDILAGLLNSPELKTYLWLIPISIFASGIFLALNYWSSRAKQFGRLSIARVVSSTTTVATRLAAGFTGYVSGGVLIGTSILGIIISTSVLGSLIWLDNNHLFKVSIRCKKIITGFKRYKKFPIFSSWSGLLNTASAHLPICILAFYFPPTVVGFYALGRLVLGRPMALIGSAVGEVFFQEAADTKNRSSGLANVVEKVLKSLLSIGIFHMLLLILIAKDVFIIVFGAQWAEAGIYAQILISMIFFQFISSPLSSIFDVLERQGSYLIFDITLLSTRLISLISGGITGNILITLALFSLASILCYGFLTYWILVNTGVSLIRILLHLAKFTLYCIPMMVIIALAKWGLALNPIPILLLGAFTTILYYSILLKQDEGLKRTVKQLFSVL